MRKTVIDTTSRPPHSQEKWLDLQKIARVEITSEDPNFPIESALSAGAGAGWRAANPGEQIIRIVLDIRRPTLSELRNLRCDGLREVGHSENSFASSGTSVRKAQPAKSKIIRSIWM